MSTSQASPQHEFAADASAIMRAAATASLATIDKASGGPYASFIALACEADGTPVFLISELARHTQNLAAHPNASILCAVPETATKAPADPLTRGRVSLMGRAERTEDPGKRPPVSAPAP